MLIFHVLQMFVGLATLFDDKFHVGQCSVLFENYLMKIKTFLELFHVLQMFVAFLHSDKHFKEQMRVSNARKRIYETFPPKFA